MADEILQIDLNTASADDLTQLPGVGAEMARRIVSARPFERVDDLTQIKGISDGVLAKLRPLVVASSPEGGALAPEEGALAPEVGSLVPEVKALAPEVEARGRETKVLGLPADDIAPEVDALGIEAGDLGPETIEVEAKAPEQEPTPEPGLEPEPEQVSEREQAPEEEPELELGRVSESEQMVEAEEPWLLQEMDAVQGEAEELIEEEREAWETEPIPGFEDDIPLPEDLPEPRRPGVTRARVGWMAVVSILLATLLATLLSLGLLSFINRGQLQFATPAQANELSMRAEGLEAQAGLLAQDVEGLRKRLDNLDALSGRMDAVEETSVLLQTDVEAASAKVTRLVDQVSGLEAQAAELTRQAQEIEKLVDELESQSNRFQDFLEGIKELMDALFPAEGRSE